MTNLKHEIKINDPLLKEKVNAKHIMEAEKFMESIYSGNEIEIGENEITKLLARLHKDYLCYRIAIGSWKKRGDDFWHKMENYEYMYKRTLEKLKELGIK